jgi:site-specific DNA-cytosine methylase
VGSKTQLLKDPRAKPFFNVIDTIKLLKPAAVILENVAGFLRVYDEAKQYLHGAGTYLLHPVVLDPAKLGWPCRRERIYIIMIRADMIDTKWRTPSEFSARLDSVARDMMQPATCNFMDLLFPSGHPAAKDLLSNSVISCVQFLACDNMHVASCFALLFRTRGGTCVR